LDGYVDSIGIEADRKCQILAVGVFIGEGLSRCRVKLFKRGDDDRELLEDTGDVSLSAEEKTKEPARVSFPNPVNLLPDEVYDIEVDQTGPASFKGTNGNVSVAQGYNDLEINFQWHKPGVDTETTLKKGNIPCIWVRAESG